MFWSYESLLPLLLKDGRLSWELSRLMIQRVQLASEIVEKLAFQPVGGSWLVYSLSLLETLLKDLYARNVTLDEMAAQNRFHS